MGYEPMGRKLTYANIHTHEQGILANYLIPFQSIDQAEAWLKSSEGPHYIKVEHRVVEALPEQPIWDEKVKEHKSGVKITSAYSDIPRSAIERFSK